MSIVYVDGKYVPWEEAVIPVDDLAVLRGYAVCDILRTFQGRPYFLTEHIQRLLNSGKKIGLDLPWSEARIKEIVFTVLERNPGLEEVNIRMIATGGSSTDFFTPQQHPRLIVMATPIPSLPEEWYTQGVKVITHYEERAIPDAKVTDYIPAALAMKKAKAQGAIEAIYINSDNFAAEATTSNLFAVIKDTLVTPGQGVLKGITRQAVLTLAQNIMPVKEAPLPLSDLLGAQEVFITGTNKGVVPVVQIDDTMIGSGKPGPYTLELIQAMKAHAISFVSQDDSN